MERVTTMSQETSWWLNNMVLVGFTEKRGNAWHYMEGMQGDEPNHYPLAVPYADVVRRLFDWKPIKARTANLVPCNASEADMQIPKLDSNGQPVKSASGKPLMVPVKVIEVPEMRGIVRSDDYRELGHHSARYQIHDYEEWLLQLQSNVIGDTLEIWSAGLLKQGAQAWVQVALPETMHDDSTGMSFVPYISGSTSLDGSIATTYSGQTLWIVCDNTRNAALRESERSGRIYRAKHTYNSLSGDKVNEVRSALSIIHQTGDNVLAELKMLGGIKVSNQQFIKVMDVIMPPADLKNDSKKKITQTENRREKLSETYHSDPMAAEWKGTALGVVQAVNTYATHYAHIKGGSRVQRNMEKIIKGDFDTLDSKVMDALADVLNKPELAVSGN